MSSAQAKLIAIIVIDAILCLGGFDAPIWPSATVFRTNIVFSLYDGTVMTGNVNDARSADSQWAIWERAQVLAKTNDIPVPVYYREQRSNLVAVKSWIVSHAADFVDLDRLANHANWFQTPYHSNALESWSWNGSVWSNKYPVYPTNFPKLSVERLIDVCGLPVEKVYTNLQYNYWYGFQVGDLNVYKKFGYAEKTNYNCKYFDYTPWRQLNGSGVPHTGDIEVVTYGTNTMMLHLIANEFSSLDYGWKYIPEIFGKLVAIEVDARWDISTLVTYDMGFVGEVPYYDTMWTNGCSSDAADFCDLYRSLTNGMGVWWYQNEFGNCTYTNSTAPPHANHIWEWAIASDENLFGRAQFHHSEICAVDHWARYSNSVLPEETRLIAYVFGSAEDRDYIGGVQLPWRYWNTGLWNVQYTSGVYTQYLHGAPFYTANDYRLYLVAGDTTVSSSYTKYTSAVINATAPCKFDTDAYYHFQSDKTDPRCGIMLLRWDITNGFKYQ